MLESTETLKGRQEKINVAIVAWANILRRREAVRRRTACLAQLASTLQQGEPPPSKRANRAVLGPMERRRDHRHAKSALRASGRQKWERLPQVLAPSVERASTLVRRGQRQRRRAPSVLTGKPRPRRAQRRRRLAKSREVVVEVDVLYCVGDDVDHVRWGNCHLPLFLLLMIQLVRFLIQSPFSSSSCRDRRDTQHAPQRGEAPSVTASDD